MFERNILVKTRAYPRTKDLVVGITGLMLEGGEELYTDFTDEHGFILV